MWHKARLNGTFNETKTHSRRFASRPLLTIKPVESPKPQYFMYKIKFSNNFLYTGWMHHMDAYEAAGEEAGRKLYKNVESSIKQVLATTPHETPTIRTLAPHHKNYTSSTDQTRRTLLEKQGRAHKRCTPVDPHTWMCKSGTTSTNLHTAAM